eukprot:94811_1
MSLVNPRHSAAHELSQAANQILHAAEDYVHSGQGDKNKIITDLMQLQTAFSLLPRTNDTMNQFDIILKFLLLNNVPQQQEQKEEQQQEINSLQAHKVHDGTKGAPAYGIEKETLSELIANNKSAQAMSLMLGVSESTVRRLHFYGLEINIGRTLEESEIDALVLAIKKDFKHWGVHNCKWAIFNRFGVCISKPKISQSLRRTDPIGALTRWAAKIQRRKYSVPGPNSLWHNDTNHKLIDWRFVIFGIIDGYSRLPTVLKVNDNNKADTFLLYFVEAINEYGIPDRGRGDYGMENIQIARLQHELHENDIKSYIFGLSVHNQRIERLWGDVNSSVIITFYDIFVAMEEFHGLDKDNEIHMFTLHLIFLQRIQDRLDYFRYLWNRKPLTRINRSPLEMFGDERHTLSSVEWDYGIDWEGPLPKYVNNIQVPNMLDVPEEILVDIVSNIPWNTFINDEDGIRLWKLGVSLVEERIEIEYE